jgi:hypothetical protein
MITCDSNQRADGLVSLPLHFPFVSLCDPQIHTSFKPSFGSASISGIMQVMEDDFSSETH